MAINFRSSDGLNETPVSQRDPLPVTMTPLSGLFVASSVTAVDPGTGFDVADTVTLGGQDVIVAPVATVTHTQVITAAVVDGGTGATPGDVTLTGSTGTGTPFQCTGTIDGDGVLSGDLVVTVAGNYTVNPDDIAAEPVTGGDTSGVTVAVTMGILTASVTTPGTLTSSASDLSQTDTSGDGVGATFTSTNDAVASDISALLAIIGTASDSAGDNTVMGQLKQIAANTA